jgi:UDP-N-acetylmuramyl tripeptide synthase
MDLPDSAPPAPGAFEASHALAGANRFHGVPAVVLQPLGPVGQDGAAQGRWIALVVDMARMLAWPDPQPRAHVAGARTWLAFAAPADRLQTATAVNEWAWAAAAQMRPHQPPAHPLGPDPVAHFQALAAAETQAAQEARAVAPVPAELPTLLVTGSHGKSTVVRLLEAVAREAGVHAQVLELPRRQLLQQGLPVAQARVAVLTNVCADVRGEHAAQLLDERSEDFLVVAHALASGGALVMNGDDAALLRVALGHAHSTAPSWALFSHRHDTPLLDALRRHGGGTCAPRDGRLVLVTGGVEQDLGAVADMPLAQGGHAAQQLANLAAAALAATRAGWPADALRRVLLRFGAQHADNPGVLERWQHRGATVLIDRARHAASLAALLKLAGALGARRVGLLLGQDGRRSDEATAALAAAVAGFRPDRVFITEVPAAGAGGGREPGVMPLLLEQGLRAGGLSARALRHEHDEETAARALLAWARSGDVLLLPLHTPGLRERLMDRLSAPAG